MLKFKSVLIYTAVALLQACGGGGGGDSGTTTPIPESDNSTGLVPAAGTIGGVLREQASTLRPLRDGSRWTYRHQDFTSAAPEQVEVRQTMSANGTITEVSSLDLTDISGVRIDATGNVVVSTTLSIAPGAAPIAAEAVELRSPVRQNEQIIVLDRHITQSGIDADRDGKQDAVDIAIWRTVTGIEQITLPNRSAPIEAVRVDTTSVIRITPSGNGVATTDTHRVTTWYADGIGIIREAEPSSSGARPWDTDDVLLGYDGVETGIGYVVAPSSEIWGARWVGPALKLSDGVLLNDSEGFRRLDTRGRVLAVSRFAAQDLGSQTLSLVQLGEQYLAITQRMNSTQGYDYAIYGLSGQAVPSTDPVARLDPSDVGTAGNFLDKPGFAWTPGSRFVWVVLHSTTEIVVRRHDGSAWAGGETRIPYADAVNSNLRWSAQTDGLILAWSNASLGTYFTTRIDSQGQVVSQHGLSFPVLNVPSPSLIGEGSDQWAVWYGPGPSPNSSASPHAVRLGQEGELVGTAQDQASVLAATVPGLDGADNYPDPYFTQGLTVQGGIWALARAYSDTLNHGATYGGYFLDFRLIQPGTSSPNAAGLLASFKIPSASLRAEPFVFDKYVLLLTTPDQERTQATVVWRQ